MSKKYETVARQVSRRNMLVGVAGVAALAGVGIEFAHPESARAAGGWGGYENGKIPLSAMSQVAGQYARPDAAAALTGLMAAFKTANGVDVGLTSGYRNYATQESIFRSRYHQTVGSGDYYWKGSWWTKNPGASTAAPPGRSQHGWGLAMDFGAPVTTNNAAHAWMSAHSQEWGWLFTGYKYGESWHWEYTGSYTPTTEDGMTQADLDAINIMIQRATRYRLYKNSSTGAIMAFNITSGDIMDNPTGDIATITTWQNLELVGNGENAVVVSPAEWQALRDRAALIKA